MPIGYVKWFNDKKGYGFIASHEIDGDIFVHFSAIVMSGYKTLQSDMTVDFELVKTARGYLAQGVRPAGQVVAQPDSDIALAA